MKAERKRRWPIRRAWKASWGSYLRTQRARRPGDEWVDAAEGPREGVVGEPRSSDGIRCPPLLSLGITLKYFLLTSSGASLLAQGWRTRLPVQETRVWSLHREDPLEKDMATHSTILAWRILSRGDLPISPKRISSLLPSRGETYLYCKTWPHLPTSWCHRLTKKGDDVLGAPLAHGGKLSTRALGKGETWESQQSLGETGNGTGFIILQLQFIHVVGVST